MKVTLKDIARECAVSVGAVSDILNSKGSFKEETRARVLDTVRRLNYRGVAGITGADTAGRQTIGLVVPSADVEQDLFFSQGIAGVKGAASDHERTVALYAEDEIIDILNGVKSGETAALPGSLIIFAPFKNWDPYLPALTGRGIRVVLAYRETEVSGVATVTNDKYQGILLALEHLYGLGHTRIVLIRRVPREPDPVPERAWRDFLQAHGLAFEESFVADVKKHTHDSFRAWFGDVMRLDDPPTAFLCEADDLAVGMINLLQRRGYRVPEDAAVVGFNDSLIARQFAPGITSVYNPVREISRLAVELITSDREAALEQAFPVSHSTVRYVLACRLVVRESCGAENGIKREVL